MTSTGSSIRPTPRAQLGGLAVGQPEARRVVGMDQHRAAVRPAAQQLAGCASTSCSSAAGGGRSARGRRRRASTEPRATPQARDVGQERRRARARSCPRACAGARAAAARAGRGRCRAARPRASPSDSPSGPGAEAVAVGPAAQQQVEQPLGAAAPAARAPPAARPDRARRRASRSRASRGERSPATRSSSASTSASGPGPRRSPVSRSRISHSSGSPAASGEHRRRVVGDVADGEAVERDVVVRALERRRRRQDHVGVARGLVEVEVDADHELERLERRGQPLAVRRREHRVAGDREQRADLALARGLDLLRQAGDGQLAEHLGAARARGCASGPKACAPGARSCRPAGRPAAGTSRRPARRGCRSGR